MARHVLDSRMVAHTWAQQSDDNTHARNGGGSLYFTDSTIYSYGSHFPVARIIRHPRTGARAAYVTTRTASVTTTKHCGMVRSALRDTDTVFHLAPAAWDDRSAALTEYRERITACFQAACRARINRAWKVETVQELITEANSYATWHGCRTRFPALDVNDLPALTEKMRAAEVRARQAAARKEREEVARGLRAVEMWVTGATVAEINAAGYGPFTRYTGPVRLRVEGAEVVTTMGARVPVDHAARLWPIIQRVRASGVAYQRNGHSEHVGNFTVDTIETDGTLTAGCHVIAYDELARVAGLLGLEG